MKRIVKKALASAISISMIISAISAVTVNAEISTLLDENFTTWTDLSTDVTTNGWAYSNTASNSTMNDAFKLNDGLEIYTGLKGNGIDKLEKKFSPISIGDTLTISGQLSLPNGANWYTGDNVAIRIGNGEHHWTLLNSFNGGEGTKVAACAKDANVDNGWGISDDNNFDFSNVQYGFDGIKGAALNYTATLAPSGDGYTLTVDLGRSEVQAKSVALTVEEATSLDTILFTCGSNGGSTRVSLIKVKSLQLNNDINEEPILEFGNNVLYNNSGVWLDENMTAWTNLDGVAEATDSEFTRGAKWAYSNTASKSTMNDAFKLNDGLEIYTGVQGNGVDKLEKKFSPISAGDTLTISGQLSLPNGANWYTGDNVAIRIGNGEHHWTLLNSFNGGEGTNVAACDKDANVGNGWSVSTENKFDFSNVQYGFDGIKGAVLNYTATLAPSGDGYTLTVDLGRSEVQAKSASLTVKEATSLDTISFTCGTSGGSTRVSLIKVKSLKLEAAGTKTGLVNGSNTLYLPVKNLNGKAADMQVIAAVCDADGMQKSFSIAPYTDLVQYNSNLAINVNIEDASTQYVRLFIFDSFDNLVPLTTAKSTKTE